MMINSENGRALVRLARHSLEQFVRQRTIHKPDLAGLATAVTHPGCSFVTITNQGQLRGCIGATEPLQPLAEDVARHAASAARDPRFTAVQPAELADIRLEVTILTPSQPLLFTDYDDLLSQLEPDRGVILAWEGKRAVLLPQVWRRVPDPVRFLDILARKAGIPTKELQCAPPVIDVHTFQVQHFAEPGYREPGN